MISSYDLHTVIITQVAIRGVDSQVAIRGVDSQVAIRGVDSQVAIRGVDSQVAIRGVVLAIRGVVQKCPSRPP